MITIEEIIEHIKMKIRLLEEKEADALKGKDYAKALVFSSQRYVLEDVLIVSGEKR